MASNSYTEAVSKVYDLLRCSICSESYDKDRQPKILRCHHTFCTTCLLQILEEHEKLECPTCHKTTVLVNNSPADVSLLQTNFYVTQLMDFDRLTGIASFGSDINEPVAYVNQDGDLCHNLCSSCIMPSNSADSPAAGEPCEQNHKSSNSHEEFEKQRATLRALLSELESMYDVHAHRERMLGEESGHLWQMRCSMEVEIDDIFDNYDQVIEKCRRQLHAQLNTMYARKKQVHQQTIDEMSRQSLSILELLKQTRKVISSKAIGEILAHQTKVTQLIQALHVSGIRSGDTTDTLALMKEDLEKHNINMKTSDEFGVIERELHVAKFLMTALNGTDC